MLTIYYSKTYGDELEIHGTPKEGCWIHIDEATQSDIRTLSQLTSVDETDLLDCLDKYELPRIEKSDDNLLIFTRYPTVQDVGLYTSTLTYIMTDKYFITACPHKCLLINTFLKYIHTYATTDRSKLLISLLMRTNHAFTSQIRKVRYTVLSAEKEMINVESDDITALAKNEEELNQYLSSLVPTRNVLAALSRGRVAPFNEEEQELLDDTLTDVKQSEELCSIVLKSIRSLRDSYQIIFANNLHKTIKLLTSLTIILSIPTMIASVYGMNVNLPLAKNTFAFGIVMAFTAVLSICGLWIFKKKGWL